MSTDGDNARGVGAPDAREEVFLPREEVRGELGGGAVEQLRADEERDGDGA